MGLLTSQIRILYLTLYKSDLEFKIQQISQTKMNLSSTIESLTDLNAGSDLDPNSPEIKLLNQRQERLHLVEKKLDAEMERYQTQLNAVTVEIDSANKLLEGDVKSSFSYAGGGSH
jgi:hypothetical protein